MTSRVVLILQVFVLLSSTSFNVRAKNSELPCDFLHSVNISDGEPDYYSGIIDHGGVYYYPINYAFVNYSYDDAGDKIEVAEHTRGCVCQVKNCVWVCCMGKISYRGEYPTCSTFNASRGLIVEMIDDTDSAEKVDLTTRDNIFLAFFNRNGRELFAAEHSEWNMNAVSEA